MRIAIDLDEVIFDYVGPFLEFRNKLLANIRTRKDLTSYRFEDCDILPPGTNHAWTTAFADAGNLRYLPLMPGAAEAISKLIEAGHQIVFITSRNKKYSADTTESIETNLPILPHVHYSSTQYTKGMYVNDLKADVFIDDNPLFTNEVVATTNATVILLSEIEKSIADSTADYKVRSWDELLHCIDAINEKAQV